MKADRVLGPLASKPVRSRVKTPKTEEVTALLMGHQPPSVVL